MIPFWPSFFFFNVAFFQKEIWGGVHDASQVKYTWLTIIGRGNSKKTTKVNGTLTRITG